MGIHGFLVRHSRKYIPQFIMSENHKNSIIRLNWRELCLMKYINLFKWRAPQSTKRYRDIDFFLNCILFIVVMQCKSNYWCWKKLNNLVAAGIYAIVQDKQKKLWNKFLFSLYWTIDYWQTDSQEAHFNNYLAMLYNITISYWLLMIRKKH